MLKKVNKLRIGQLYEITGMDYFMHGAMKLSHGKENSSEKSEKPTSNVRYYVVRH